MAKAGKLEFKEVEGLGRGGKLLLILIENIAKNNEKTKDTTKDKKQPQKIAKIKEKMSAIAKLPKSVRNMCPQSDVRNVRNHNSLENNEIQKKCPHFFVKSCHY